MKLKAKMLYKSKIQSNSVGAPRIASSESSSLAVPSAAVKKPSSAKDLSDFQFFKMNFMKDKALAKLKSPVV